MRQFIQFLSLLLFSGTLVSAEPSSSAKTSSSVTATVKKDSVLLKLLEPIAPQAIKDPHKKDQKGEEIEIVHSNLGELLKDPKNENLKDVKVVGKQRRLKTDTENFTIIRWEEVALETNKTGQDGTVESGGGEFVKEPVEKPLESSFIQTSESIAPGTPIEAAGDSQSLLAAARTLMIKVQKQGGKTEAIKTNSTTSKIEGNPKVSNLMTNEGMNSQGADEAAASSSQNFGQDSSNTQSAGQGRNPSPNGYQGGQSSFQQSFSGGGGSSGGRVSNRGGLGFNNGNPYQVAEREKREAAEREKREAELRAAQSQNAQQPQSIVVNTGNNPAAQNGQVENREGAGNAERNAPQNPAVNPAANGRDGNPDQARNVDRNAPQKKEDNLKPAVGKDKVAFDKKRLAVDPSNPEARRSLGNLYAEGGIVAKDTARSVKMYTKASEAGDIPSFVALGDLAVSQNKTKKAVNHYRQAAEKNDPEALLKLAALLEKKGSAQDRKESAALRKRATQALQARQRENAHISQGLSPELLNQIAEKAAANDPDAQRTAGIILLNGIGAKKDENQGLELLKRAASQGDTQAMNRLADYLKDKDPKQAFEYRKRAAKKEEGRRSSHLTPLDQFIANVEAEQRYNQALGASSLSSTTSSPPDLSEMERAANLGHPTALRKLGEMYAEGKLVPRDSAMALDLFRKAAEKGDSQALVDLGDIAFKDNNIADAKNYYRQAALKNNPTAQIKLASVLENHPRSPADQKEAQALRKAASENEKKIERALTTTLEITPSVVQELMIQANNGNKRAQTALAILNAKGQGVEENQQKAIEYLEEAAKQGDVNAQVLLSNAYKKGKGVAHDAKTAVGLLEQASQSPSIPGEGTIPEQAKEARETLRYYKKALEEADTRKRERDAEGRPADLEGKADQGDAIAQRKLANHYSQQKKHEKALEWNTRAAEQNDAAAQVALGDAYLQGRGVKANPSIALDLYSKAAAQDDPEAQLKLAELLEGGIGCPRDQKAAEKWRQKASETAQWKKDQLAQRASQLTPELIHSLQQSAEKGSRWAQATLGVIHKEGQGGVDKNAEEAVMHLNQAVEQGDIPARIALASLYDKGKGIDQDSKEAVRLLKEAAQVDSGLLSRKRTVPEQAKDERDALKRYQKALAALEERAEKGKGHVFFDSDDEGYSSEGSEDEDVSFASSASSSAPINISSSSASHSRSKPEEEDRDNKNNPWEKFDWKNSPHEGGNGVDPFLAHQGKDRKDVDPKSTERTFEDGEENKDANITIEYDLKNSLYETDFDKKEVRQIAKMLTFQDGRLIETSKDYAVIKSFKIQKDYTHPDCQDYVELKDEAKEGEEGLGFAYATYRPFWINEASERIYLKGPEPDKDHPMALREEAGKCSYALDFDAMKATSQSEIVYTNRSGHRVVYQNCHKTASSKDIPITITQQGCKPLHDLKKGVSYRRQRFVYTVNGVQHEALECHCILNDKGIEHQFKEGEPLVEKASNLYQPTAQRYVVFVNSNGEQEKIKLSGYEPVGKKAPLKFDEAVCQISPHEDGYHHDMERGHSYVLGRWYYDGLKGKNYVSPSCVKRDKAYPHKQLITGYKHEDANKRSYPITSLAIEPTPGKAIAIKGKDQIIDYSHPQPYTKVEERSGESTDKEWFDACHKTIRTKQKAIYKRVDNSEYEEALPDKVQRSENLCTYSTTPVGYEHAGMSWGKGKEFIFYEGLTLVKLQHMTHQGIWGPDSGYMWETEKVLVDEFIQYPVSPFHPKGKKELKHHRIWQDEYQDKNVQQMIEWDLNNSPPTPLPYKTKKWKKGERKVDLRFK